MKEAVVLRAMGKHPHIVQFAGILETPAWNQRPGIALLLQWEDWTVYDALHRSSVAFGFRDDRSPARPCVIVGTPHWASPEVLGEVEAGFPADVWSAGMLLYEMAECRIPLEGLSYSQVIIAVLFSE